MDTDNKLFTEFLDAKVATDTYFLNGMYVTDKEENLKFKSDWNLLMEVVLKIESYGYVFETKLNWVKISKNKKELIVRWEQDKTKFEAIYNACLELINWYNKQTK